MILLIKLIIICVIWCMGVKIVTSPRMVFQELGFWANKKVDEGKIMFEPLITCEWCLPSVHTLIAFIFAFGIGVIDSWSWSLLFYYPLVAMGSSLFNGLIWQFYLTQAIKKDALDKANVVLDLMIKDRENESDYSEEELGEPFFDYSNFNN